MSKYESIVEALTKRIHANEFSKNNKLPTEAELMEEYQVSRNTIRNAIAVLKEDGIIYPVQGSGYYIHYLEDNSTFLGGTKGVTADHPGKTLTTKLLSIDIVPCSKEISKLMNCPIETPLYYLERLRIIDGEPYSIEYTYYHQEIIPHLDKEIAEGSIYRYLQEELHLSFGFTDKYISCDLLKQKEAELLQLKENDPWLVIEDRAHLSNGLCFNVSRCVYHYKKAKYYTIVK